MEEKGKERKGTERIIAYSSWVFCVGEVNDVAGIAAAAAAVAPSPTAALAASAAAERSARGLHSASKLLSAVLPDSVFVRLALFFWQD